MITDHPYASSLAVPLGDVIHSTRVSAGGKSRKELIEALVAAEVLLEATRQDCDKLKRENMRLRGEVAR